MRTAITSYSLGHTWGSVKQPWGSEEGAKLKGPHKAPSQEDSKYQRLVGEQNQKLLQALQK